MKAETVRRPGRPRSFDTGGALDRAIEVFLRRGYEGAGVAELTRAMGVSPPSLYAAFGDKRGLFLAALDRYAATSGGEPLAALRTEGDVGAFLEAAVDLAHGQGRSPGCLAACVAGDAAGGDPVIRRHLDALLRGQEAALAEAAGEGGPSGRLLLAAMHAISVRARAGATRSELDDLARDLADRLGREPNPRTA
jgi:AcrR family transcriptional regulator